MISRDMDPAEIGALVCETLSAAGISAVLTGGTCVSVWTRNEFASLDLDFIALGLHSNKEIARALEGIGFNRSVGNPRYFEHPDTELSLEFPPGPLMVGDEHIRSECRCLRDRPRNLASSQSYRLCEGSPGGLLLFSR